MLTTTTSPPPPNSLNAGADLGINFEFELFEGTEASEQTCPSVNASPSSSPSPTHPTKGCPATATAALPIPPAPLLPSGKLNLKLDIVDVATSWSSMSGNSPAFSMPRGDLESTMPTIPSAAARAASLAVDAQQGWDVGAEYIIPPSYALAVDPSSSGGGAPARVVAAPRPTAGAGATAALLHTATSTRPPTAPRPRKSAASKRRSGSKASDKRPRIKGRFVRRDELEQYLAVQTVKKDHHGVEDAMHMVPDESHDDFFVAQQQAEQCHHHHHDHDFGTVDHMSIDSIGVDGDVDAVQLVW